MEDEVQVLNDLIKIMSKLQYEAICNADAACESSADLFINPNCPLFHEPLGASESATARGLLLDFRLLI
jgi:hypothetical protein